MTHHVTGIRLFLLTITSLLSVALEATNDITTSTSLPYPPSPPSRLHSIPGTITNILVRNRQTSLNHLITRLSTPPGAAAATVPHSPTLRCYRNNVTGTKPRWPI
ncbi:hypothetical protein E2C01_049406 [Portunus trituberculatus]|uniref:Secreted protein n=1 Tax=Portunus trituberculatus TaxID=210409 RepID=A0A5B7GD01_PORTR|nr:hypothetical protein [Portunus trituberculatus]